MTNFDKQKLTEIVLYILNKTNGLDYYHVFKVIYFANIAHLAKYGFRMTTDEFCALPDGPVPSILYDCVKDDLNCDKELETMIDKCIAKGNDDAYYFLTAKRDADLDYLSKADMEEIDEAIKKYAYMPYNKLRDISHGEEWHRAYSTSGRKVMDVVGMAKDGNATQDMLEYIRENLEIEEALA
ncbi:MAG: Panacea domain-containing protein [Prevotellaceae bacterium]|nr:Panacea domain-containing protein [Prevotellaceae bacterium]